MAVTKQTYTAAATWTAAQLADLFRDAFIDAGLMTAWFDAFSIGSLEFRVAKIEHDAAKTYGSSFYCFIFRVSLDDIGVALSSGWDASTDLPTGTEFVDYHLPPSGMTNNVRFGAYATKVSDFVPSNSTDISLDRYTSTIDTKQSWFVLRQGLSRSAPFAILHKDTTLHPWLDLDKGMISGYSTIAARAASRMGLIDFRLQMNLRRCLLIGAALRGQGAVGFGDSGRFHTINYPTHCYMGVGSASAAPTSNLGSPVSSGAAAVALPVAKNSANPAFLTDYVPICTNLPWSPFTPTRLADDFGIYMHYADNTTAYGDKFIVQAGINEWETLQFANNAVVVDGASATFLARVV
jgi:hypothetical protein